MTSEQESYVDTQEIINNNNYIHRLQQLENLQKKKSCTLLSPTNPVILFPAASLVILALSSLLTILKLEATNLVLLPFKLITGVIMILFLSIVLVLICNFFSDTVTWVVAIIFLLITAVGAPMLIYFGTILLVIVFALGISGTTIASVIYYFKDNINRLIYGTPEEKLEDVKVSLEEYINPNVSTGINGTKSNGVNGVNDVSNEDVVVRIDNNNVQISGLNEEAIVSINNEEILLTSDVTAGTINTEISSNISL